MNRAHHDAEKQQAPHIASAVEQGDPPIHATDEATNYDDNNTEKPWLVQRCLQNLNWMPPWCRWDKEQPPAFSIWLNVLFAFAGAFTVANLYYNHPILNVLAHDFGVSYLTVSRVPTLVQAGYLIGLIFVCPLGDLFPRRQFTLILVLFTATLWYVWCGLAIPINAYSAQDRSMPYHELQCLPRLLIHHFDHYCDAADHASTCGGARPASQASLLIVDSGIRQPSWYRDRSNPLRSRHELYQLA